MNLAKKITDYTIENFYNKNTGLFYYTLSNKTDLIARKTEVDDGVIPSSNSVMAMALYSLGVIYDDSSYTALPKTMLTTVSDKLNTFPVYHAHWCSVAGLFANGTYEVILVGKDAIPRSRELQNKYLPDCVVMGASNSENLPLLENKLVTNKTLIYVCTNKVCKRPVADVASALNQLKRKT